MMLMNGQNTLARKQYQYSILLIILFTILLVRFFYLQIYKRAQYLRASENNRIREVVIEPTRGLILDRNGEVLVDNHPSYSVYAIPFEVLKSDSVLNLTARILKTDAQDISETIRRKRSGSFTPVKLKRQIEFETLSRLEENRLDLPGIGYQIEPKRYYPSGVRAPHLFGYLGEITRKELRDPRNKQLRLGDIVGKKGLEKVYDNELRGSRGYKYLEIDALGREVRELTEKGEVLPVPGKNLHLTIDAGLQRYLESRMDKLRGGAVVVNCSNGEIIALVSKPDYEPEIFSKLITPETWQKLLDDPTKPLYDRMVQSLYPPGSTYKLILAAAALERGKGKVRQISTCQGSYLLGNKHFDCWKPEGHGRVNFLEAIEQSCNVYFYELSLDVGLDSWAEFSRKFLFGQPTDIDLMDEKPGLVPDRNYLNRRYGRNRWSKGMLLNLGIGQGDLLVTPLQMVRLAMIIANEGIYHQLHLVQYLENPLDNTKKWAEFYSQHIRGVSGKTYQMLKQGMFRVVNGENGTAKLAQVATIQVAGKTGTAQNPHGEPHAWFIGFAPYDDPQIAFCILVENGGSGGSVAAPIARDLIREYFNHSDVRYAQ